MKEHQQTHMHKRYYIYRHVNGEQVDYRYQIGGFTDDFYQAMLWSDLEFVKKKAEGLAKIKSGPDRYDPNKTIVIGCVDVAIDGLFFPVAVK